MPSLQWQAGGERKVECGTMINPAHAYGRGGVAGPMYSQLAQVSRLTTAKQSHGCGVWTNPSNAGAHVNCVISSLALTVMCGRWYDIIAPRSRLVWIFWKRAGMRQKV